MAEHLESNSLDAVVLSSVVQYFPDVHYLLEVLEGSLRVVRPGGFIFLADIRNYRLLRAFHTSLELYQAGRRGDIPGMRSRIARDLHDGLGPSLAGLGNKLRACLYVIHEDPAQAEREIGEVADQLKGHIQEIRALSHDLRPMALDRLGLLGAIEEHLDYIQRSSGLQTSIVAPSMVELDQIGVVAVFRIVQECLANKKNSSP